ncbi:MAG: pitrilysin family protein [Planctomycetota bacterium]
MIGAYWNAWAFRGHPYARPTSGDEGQVAGVKHAQVQALAQRQLAPGRTWIAIAGDVDGLELSERLQETFGAWEPREGADAATPAVKARPGKQVLLVDAPGSLQTYFRAGNLGFDWSDPDYAARYLANTILGGRFTSRLNTALRIESGLTYGARSGFDDVQAGMFSLSSYTATATSREAIELARATYARFRAEGITQAELESARTYIQGQYAPDELETPAQRARVALDLELAGVPRARIEGLFQALDALDLEAVNRVIQRLPAPEALRWVLLGQAEVLRPLAKELGEVTEVELSAPGFGPE